MLYEEAQLATFMRFRATIYFKMLYLKACCNTFILHSTNLQIRRTTLHLLMLYLQGFRTIF